MDLAASAISLGISVVVAVVTTKLTVHFALKRFYAEKWWERKCAAYASIIESLHHVKNHADTNLAFSLRNVDLPEQGDRELTEKLEAAMAELRKQLDIGAFVLSDEAVSIMNQLMVELDEAAKETQWVEHLQEKLDAVVNCLSNMRRPAREDLQIQ